MYQKILADQKQKQLFEMPKLLIDNYDLNQMLGGERADYKVMNSMSGRCSIRCSLKCTINSRCY